MDKALEQYLNTVDRKLRPLPASERADIVREIKSAMQDMAADGLPTEGILDRLGRPDALARAYLSDLLDKPERGGWRRLPYSSMAPPVSRAARPPTPRGRSRSKSRAFPFRIGVILSRCTAGSICRFPGKNTGEKPAAG